MILLTLPFYVGYGLCSAYLITYPEIEPYFSRARLVVVRDRIAGLVAFWIAFLALGSLERRRPGPHRLYALVGILSWWVGAGAVAYGLGPITSPAWIGIIFGVVCQLLLLPQAMALGGIAFGLCLVVASMVAVGLGAVPYALIYVGRGATHDIENDGAGQLALAWIVTPPGLEGLMRAIGRRRLAIG
jgi:hypothetical protein